MSRQPSRRGRERRQRSPQRQQKAPPGTLRQQLLRVYLPIVVILAVITTAGLIFLGGWARRSAAPVLSPEFLEGSAKGAKDAKVVLTEYSDFQCPYCAKFARETGRDIDETFVKSGQVRFVYRHFAFIGPESQWAAEASECAKEQGRFWDYHDKLFFEQSGENRGAFSRENLGKFATSLGLDRESFNKCLSSERYAPVVKDQTEEARRKGLRSTPTFFVNDRKVEGALPFEDFRKIIEEELRKGM